MPLIISGEARWEERGEKRKILILSYNFAFPRNEWHNWKYLFMLIANYVPLWTRECSPPGNTTSWKTTKWRDEAVKLTIYSVSSPLCSLYTHRGKGIGWWFDTCATVEKKRRFTAQGSRFLLSVPSGWKKSGRGSIIVLLDPLRHRRFQTIGSPLSFPSIHRYFLSKVRQFINIDH